MLMRLKLQLSGNVTQHGFVPLPSSAWERLRLG